MMKFFPALVFIICGVFSAVSLAAQTNPKAAPTSSKAMPTENANGIKWLSYTEGLAQAKSRQKLIFVDLYADWCVPCRIMDANVYTDSGIAELLNERFIPVKLDADSQEKISCDGQLKTAQKCFHEVWELKALPSFVLVAPKGLSILTVTQSLTVTDLKELLTKFLSKEKEWLAR